MRVIQIAPEDNVAVALCPITAGEVIQIGEQVAVKVLEDVPQGHKIALKEIKKLSMDLQLVMQRQRLKPEVGCTHIIWQQTWQERLNIVISRRLNQFHRANRNFLKDFEEKMVVQQLEMKFGLYLW